jgi:hypothetical protein
MSRTTRGYYLPRSEEPATDPILSQSTASHHIPLMSILILPFRLCLGLPSEVFPLCSPSNIFYNFPALQCLLHAPQIFFFFICPNNIRRNLKIIKFLVMKFSQSLVPLLQYFFNDFH